jgi:hypothetical protein
MGTGSIGGGRRVVGRSFIVFEVVVGLACGNPGMGFSMGGGRGLAATTPAKNTRASRYIHPIMEEGKCLLVAMLLKR